jgi:hypothetical protein
VVRGEAIVGGTFFRVARRAALVVALATAAGALTAPVRADDGLDPVLGNPGPTYPDVVPDTREVFVDRPIVGFDPVTFDPVFGPPMLWFDTWSQNLGTVALDLVADDPTDFLGTTVSQCVSWRAPAVCRERAQVGGFVWHDEHTHFHYQDFASYELRRLGSDGRPDYSAAGLVDISDKVSFCLLDSVQVAPDAVPAPTYIGCTPAREGISAGWADIYTTDLEGQQLSMEGLPDGRYALVITLDTADTLFEADNTNNRVEVTFDLSGGATTVTVVDKHYPTLGGDGGCRPKGKGRGSKPDNGRGKGKDKC